MKKRFNTIRQSNLEEALILDRNPDLVSCWAKVPLKKGDGTRR